MHDSITSTLEQGVWTQLVHRKALRDFPVMPLSGKIPLTAHGVNDASADPKQIALWAQQYPDANVGFAVPPGYVVIDVDPRNGGNATIETLEARHGELPPTLTVRTGGGGLHLVYRTANQDDALPGRLGPGVDIKQPGGYIVGAGSTHPDSGQRYTWVNESVEVSPLPMWIQARTFPRGQRSPNTVDLTGLSDALPPIWSPSQHDAIAARLSSLMVDGQKHFTNVAFGGWARQRGATTGDVLEIVQRVFPGDAHAAKAVLWAFGVDNRTGYRSLASLVGADQVEVLGALCPPAFSGIMPENWLQSATKVNAVAAATDTLGELKIIRHTAMREPRPPLEYLCEDLCMRPGAPLLMIGFGFSGKTWLAYEIAAAVASQRPILDRFPVRPFAGKTAAIVLDFEMGEDLCVRRCHDIYTARGGEGPDAIVDPPLVFVGNPKLDAALEARLVGLLSNYAFCAVDALHGMFPQGDENTAEFRNVVDMLNRVSIAAQCVIGIVHHSGKGAQKDARMAGRGSAAIFDAAGSALFVEVTDDGQGPIKVTHTKARATGKRVEPFRLVIDGEGTVTAEDWETATAGQEKPGAKSSQGFQRVRACVLELRPNDRFTVADAMAAAQLDPSDQASAKVAEGMLGNLVKTRDLRKGREPGLFSRTSYPGERSHTSVGDARPPEIKPAPSPANESPRLPWVPPAPATPRELSHEEIALAVLGQLAPDAAVSAGELFAVAPKLESEWHASRALGALSRANRVVRRRDGDGTQRYQLVQ